MSRAEMLSLTHSQRERILAAVKWLAGKHGSQEAAARAAGVAQSTFAEHGSRGTRSWSIAPGKLEKIAAAAGVIAADLLAGKGPRPEREKRAVHMVRHSGGVRT